MRYRLGTLLIVLAVLPPLIWAVVMMDGCIREWLKTDFDLKVILVLPAGGNS